MGRSKVNYSRDTGNVRAERCAHTGGLMTISHKWLRCKFCLGYVRKGSLAMVNSERRELSATERAEVRRKVASVVARVSDSR